MIVVYLGEFYSTKKRDIAILTASIILGIICVLLPFVASLIINTGWNLEIPFMDNTFKPWRLFMLISGTPNLITGVSLYFLPESPKFLVQKHHVGNNERKLYVDYKEFETYNSSSVWKQSLTLFSKKNLSLTFTILWSHFFVFAIGGMGSWYPEIVNSVTSYIKENENGTATICEIFVKRLRPLQVEDVCLDKFEFSALPFVIFSEILFVMVMLAFSVAIRWISKPVLLSKCDL